MARALVTATRLVPSGLRRRLQRLALRTGPGRRLVWREKGVEHELDFWTRWFESEGLYWPDDYRRRLDPDAPLEEELVADRLDALPGGTVSILDVGAGPLTFLGKRHPRKALELTPIDALADEYDRLLERFGVEPPVRTLQCPGEQLLERFGPESFDVAYARNSLDHSYDPLATIRNMVAAVRPHGFVALRHVRTEGAKQNYSGFHQWNFDLADGRLVLSGKATRHDVGAELGPHVRVEAFAASDDEDDWVLAVVTKTPA